jgi:DNA-binding MurR/RpiR family transcriptional regulator
MTSPVVADALRGSLASLTPSEQRIARVLQADYPRAGLETIARLAERAQVSPPTVVRFVAKLGFGGYPQFQERLRQEIAERASSPLAQYAAPPARSTEEGVLGRAERVLCGGLLESFAGLPVERFEAALDLICDPGRRVLTIGGRYSSLLAQYLFTHLHLLRPGARHVPAAAMDRMAALLDVGRRDVVVAYDFRRYQADTVDFGEIAKEQGAALVLFTDPWLSPLAARADVVVPCSVQAPSPFDALTPAVALTEALIAGIVDRLGDAPRDRIGRFETYQGRIDGQASTATTRTPADDPPPDAMNH